MCSLLRLCRGPSDAEPVDRVSRAAPSISHFNERAGIRIPMFCVIIIRVFQLMLSFHCPSECLHADVLPAEYQLLPASLSMSCLCVYSTRPQKAHRTQCSYLLICHFAPVCKIYIYIYIYIYL